jgi:hypothetical protein
MPCLAHDSSSRRKDGVQVKCSGGPGRVWGVTEQVGKALAILSGMALAWQAHQPTDTCIFVPCNAARPGLLVVINIESETLSDTIRNPPHYRAFGPLPPAQRHEERAALLWTRDARIPHLQCSLVLKSGAESWRVQDAGSASSRCFTVSLTRLYLY